MRKRRAKGEAKTSRAKASIPVVAADYGRLVTDISTLLEEARRTAARAVNRVLTATYWEIGRRIVEHEQGGKERAEYGEELLGRLSKDLRARYGRGFSERNLRRMRVFYLDWEICQTPSGNLEARVIFSTVSGESESKIRQALSADSAQLLVSLQVPPWPAIPLAEIFPLSWSQYVRLMSVEKPQARAFCESEAIRGGWSVRQLDRPDEEPLRQEILATRTRSRAFWSTWKRIAFLPDLRIR